MLFYLGPNRVGRSFSIAESVGTGQGLKPRPCTLPSEEDTQDAAAARAEGSKPCFSARKSASPVQLRGTTLTNRRSGPSVSRHSAHTHRRLRESFHRGTEGSNPASSTGESAANLMTNCRVALLSPIKDLQRHLVTDAPSPPSTPGANPQEGPRVRSSLCSSGESANRRSLARFGSSRAHCRPRLQAGARCPLPSDRAKRLAELECPL